MKLKAQQTGSLADWNKVLAVTEEIMDENEIKRQIEEKKEALEELAKKLEEKLNTDAVKNISDLVPSKE